MGKGADSAARVARDSDREGAPIRPAQASGLYTLARLLRADRDEYEGLDHLDRADLDESDDDAMTPPSWRHPLSRGAHERSRVRRRA
jgi:hypothetical protein